MYEHTSNNDFIPQDILYYFHSDHLGSASFLTDADGDAYQFFVYLPWGDWLVQRKIDVEVNLRNELQIDFAGG